MRALSFLSRIPVHNIFFEGEDRSMGQSAGAFPAAGLIIALPSALVAALLAHFHADPLLAAAIVLAILTMTTGALHEDGLADTTDGFGGGRTKERILDIMKDSRIGNYGAIALVLSFLLRAAAIAALMRELSPLALFSAILMTAAVSRGLMVWHWQALSPARDGGVAVSAGQPGVNQRNAALASSLGLTLLLGLPFLALTPLVLTLAAACVANRMFNRACLRKIDGHTGDTIGATQQITEIVILSGLALFA